MSYPPQNVPLAVPPADSALNQVERDVIGQKGDTAVFTPDGVSSLMRYIKGLVSAIGPTLVASGTFTFSSATVPADNARTEGNDYFNGCLLIPLTGAVALQPRRIVDYTGVGGIFTIDPNNPFTAATGLVAYVVVAEETEFVPGVDGVNNRTPSDVIGNKTDTALQVAAANASQVRYLKGLITALGNPTGETLATITAKWGNIARSLDLILGNRWDAAGDLGTDIAAIIAYVDTLETIVGTEGGVALADKLTAARALLLDQITAPRLAELDPANIPADTDPRVMGRSQVKATTIDLNQGIGTYVLFTATTQDVVVEKLVIRMSGGAIGGALTSISIQTDDATPQVFISAVQGAVANLTNEAQLAWTGAILLDAGTAATIGLTIAGGAAGVARVCDVIAECRAVVAGGYLA